MYNQIFNSRKPKYQQRYERNRIERLQKKLKKEREVFEEQIKEVRKKLNKRTTTLNLESFATAKIDLSDSGKKQP